MNILLEDKWLLHTQPCMGHLYCSLRGSEHVTQGRKEWERWKMCGSVVNCCLLDVDKAVACMSSLSLWSGPVQVATCHHFFSRQERGCGKLMVAGGRVATVAMPCPQIQPQGRLRQATLIKPSNSIQTIGESTRGTWMEERSVGERGRQEEVMG